MFGTETPARQKKFDTEKYEFLHFGELKFLKFKSQTGVLHLRLKIRVSKYINVILQKLIYLIYLYHIKSLNERLMFHSEKSVLFSYEIIIARMRSSRGNSGLPSIPCAI